MKNIIFYIKTIFMVTAITLGLNSCSADDFSSPNESEIPLAANYEDAVKIEVNQETNIVTFTFEAKGVMPVWIIDGKTYSSTFSMTKYYRKAGDYTVDVKIANSNGMSDGVISKTFTINKTIMNGFGGYVYDSEFNLWNKAIVDNPVFWYAPGWSQIADPSYTFVDGAYNVKLVEATTETWQAQMSMLTNISTTSDKEYDFSVILTSSTNHSGVMVKLVDSSNDNVFYFAKTIALSAGEPLCFWMSQMPGLDISKLKLVLDFGGNAAGTDITVENIVFKDHANDDGTVLPEVSEPEPNWAGVNSAENLWHAVVFENSFYYAPNWSQIANPTLTIDGSVYTTSFPSATFQQWQNQVTFVTESLSLSANKSYDFRVTLNASKDIKNATIKLAQNDNDEVFLFLINNDLLAGEDVAVKVINKKGVDITKAKLVFDFGGNSENTDLTIKDIILQEHKD